MGLGAGQYCLFQYFQFKEWYVPAQPGHWCDDAQYSNKSFPAAATVCCEATFTRLSATITITLINFGDSLIHLQFNFKDEYLLICIK